MRHHRKVLARLATRLIPSSERGATAVEYAIMAAFIAAVIFVTVAGLAGTLDNIFGQADGMIAP